MAISLFTFGGVSFANKIKAETYEITPNARQDLDSYRDANGILRRNALSHKATIVEFDTIPMYNDEFSALMNAITSAYINPNERDANCSYYDFEYGGQKSGHFYLDSNWKVSLYSNWTIGANSRVLLNPVHFKFVEY